MSDFEKLIYASDLIEWIMETYPDWCVGAVRSIIDHVEGMSSAEPDESTCWGCNCPKMDSLEHPTQTNADSMQWSALDCVRRQQVIDALCNDYCGGHQDCKYYPNCENLKSIEQLPSAQSSLDEWCTDCKEYDADNHCCPRFNRVIREALKEWLAESTYAIGRQVTIDIIQSYKKNTERLKEISVEDVVDMFEDLIDDIENESSVQPVREKGRWLLVSDGYTDCVKCDKCGEVWDVEKNFCPNCGSYNGGEK